MLTQSAIRTPQPQQRQSIGQIKQTMDPLTQHLQHHELGTLFLNHPDRLLQSECHRAIGHRKLPSVYAMNSLVSGSLSMSSSSSPSKHISANPLFKTNYCREYSLGGVCLFGDKCHFAHGAEELRPLPLPVNGSNEGRGVPLRPVTDGTGIIPLSSSSSSLSGYALSFSSSSSSSSASSLLNDHVYKTELCAVFIRDGTCRYGIRCHFAHGLRELRPRSFGHGASSSTGRLSPQGRCLQWASNGQCRFGDDCRFLHGVNSGSLSPAIGSPSSNPSSMTVILPGPASSNASAQPVVSSILGYVPQRISQNNQMPSM